MFRSGLLNDALRAGKQCSHRTKALRICPAPALFQHLMPIKATGQSVLVQHKHLLLDSALKAASGH